MKPLDGCGRKIIVLLVFKLRIKGEWGQLVDIIILDIKLLVVDIVLLFLLRSQNDLIVFILKVLEVFNFRPNQFLLGFILSRVRKFGGLVIHGRDCGLILNNVVESWPHLVEVIQRRKNKLFITELANEIIWRQPSLVLRNLLTLQLVCYNLKEKMN